MREIKNLPKHRAVLIIGAICLMVIVTSGTTAATPNTYSDSKSTQVEIQLNDSTRHYDIQKININISTYNDTLLINGTPPTDPDNDGLYEDINGDGVADLQDLKPFFNIIRPNVETPQTSKLDFNQDGRTNLQDLNPFFNEVSSTNA